jgi:hypothetical protein
MISLLRVAVVFEQVFDPGLVSLATGLAKTGAVPFHVPAAGETRIQGHADLIHAARFWVDVISNITLKPFPHADHAKPA